MNAIRPTACSAITLVVIVGCLSCGNTDGVTQAKPPADEPLRIESLDVGEAQTCVLVSDGSVYCWGLGDYGETGAVGFTLSPQRVESLPAVISMAAGAGSTCAITAMGAFWCWGSAFGNKFGGELGGPRPVEVLAGTNASDFALAHVNICKVEQGGLYCWGGDYGAGEALPTREKVLALSHGAPTCAISASHEVLCWGFNNDGQLGDGTTTPHDLPVPTVNTGEEMMTVASVVYRVFAVAKSGTLYGWGNNGPGGALGTGDEEVRLTPTALSGLPPVRGVDTSLFHACAVSQADSVYCWGIGPEGQLGTGNTASSPVPVPVLFDRPVLDVAVGAPRSCVLTLDREVYCFGEGPLGDGTYASSSVPVRIHFPWEAAESDAGARGMGPDE